MNPTQASQDKYTKITRIASYLEAKWSDFLFATEDPSDGEFLSLVHPRFYKQVGEFTRDGVRKAKITPSRYCDIGGATGRTLYEISHQIHELSELVLVEPSLAFCEWANRFLKESGNLGWIPKVDNLERPTYIEALGRPEPIDTEKDLYIYNKFAEEVPRPTGYFDLITCLNVVDRHSNPAGLIRNLRDLLAQNGLLVLSSPLEFELDFTPHKERWINDLNVLFLESEWLSVAENNLPYDFRLYRRQAARYSSQVVIKQKI